MLEQVLRIRITLMRIRIQLFILKRIRILPFTLMLIRFQLSNMTGIHADPDPQHWLER
jgi:hypothetical protein